MSDNLTLRSLDLSKLSLQQKIELLPLLQAKARFIEQNRLRYYSPYEKQKEFHAKGKTKRERGFLAANQVGKTIAGGAETAMHLTGLYPHDWGGLRFDKPIRSMAGSESAELTRKGVQRILVGPPEDKSAWGTGMIPGDCIVSTSSRQGVADAIASMTVKHVSGGNSVIQFASYDQGRTKWQADTLDWVWFDEEPPEDVYTEGLTRTNATGGSVIGTFTPLKGMSSVVMRFVQGEHQDRSVTYMTIDDVDHLDAETKARIIASYPPHELEARTKGIPMLGSGRIFPVTEESITVKGFAIQPHWPRIAAIDFGWDHPTAVVWLAWDMDTDTVYVYDTFRQKEVTPVFVASAVRKRGDWIPIAWPHDGLQHDKGSGKQLAAQYRDEGLNLLHSNVKFEDGSNGVEAGLMLMLDRMQTGRLKVAAHLHDWFEEFRMYHREDGKVVKERDDLMAACFHPDTEVMTDSGPRRIADMAGTTGKVLTIGGAYAEYTNCRITRKSAYVVRLTFDDGHSVVCTPDHRFLTDSGWVPAIDLIGHSVHNAIPNSGGIKWTKSSTKAPDILGSATITGAHASSFTARYGRMLAGKYRKASMCITRMAIRATTTLLTLSALTGNNTYQAITKGTRDGLTQLLQRTKYGALLRKEWHSCAKAARRMATSCTLYGNSYVTAAESNTRQTTKASTDSAQMLASLSGGVTLAPTTSTIRAGIAAPPIQQANTVRASIAGSHAGERHGHPLTQGKHTSSVLRIEPAGQSDVYCLEVPSTKAFALRNGAIAHNCRYGIMALRYATIHPNAAAEFDDSQRKYRDEDLD